MLEFRKDTVYDFYRVYNALRQIVGYLDYEPDQYFLRLSEEVSVIYQDELEQIVNKLKELNENIL